MLKFGIFQHPFTVALAASTLLCLGVNVQAQSAGYKNTRAYKNAFTCGKESLESDPSGNSTISYCIGNSRDPSKIELQAFKDAVASDKNNPSQKSTKSK